MDENEDVLSSHLIKLHQLCRICGRRCVNQKQKKQKKSADKCEKFKVDILISYNININQDIYEKHSSSICPTCLFRMKDIKSNASETLVKKARDIAASTSDLWSTHKTKDCMVCKTFDETAKGTRSSKLFMIFIF